jgi:D-arginine dehydrogenase
LKAPLGGEEAGVTSFDYLVCGCGIAGASIACELAAHGRVLVVEQEDAPGYHTTGRSAAMYIESYGAPAVRALTAASRGFFDAPPEGFADYPLLTRRGCLTIASGAQAQALDAAVAELRSGGSRFFMMSGEEARAVVGALRAEAVADAVFEPDAADIDTNALHSGFVRLARARGVELRTRAGIEAMEQGGSAWKVRLAGGETIEAVVVVDAAGAWSDSVGALAGAAPIGLQPKRRTAILIDPPGQLQTAQWPVVIDVAEQFYFKPQSGLLLASPADETPSAPLDAAPDEIDIAICVDRIQAVLDFQVRRVTRAWAGLRTFAPDRVPVFGYDPKIPRFFWFAGQGGFGMQTSPAASRLGAALALGRPIPPDLADLGVTDETFSPGRFSQSDIRSS